MVVDPRWMNPYRPTPHTYQWYLPYAPLPAVKIEDPLLTQIRDLMDLGRHRGLKITVTVEDDEKNESA